MPSVNNLAEFPNFLRAYRYHKKLTQWQLAKLLQCNQASISHYESGKGKVSVTTPFYQDVLALVGTGYTVPPTPTVVDTKKVSEPVVEIHKPDTAVLVLQKLYSKIEALENKINSLLGMCQVE